MKRQIRKNVFETNSSSVHAICISKAKPDHYPSHVMFNHGEWGWDFDVLDTIEERASYLYELICEFCDGDERKKSEYMNHLYDVLGKYNIDCEFDRNDFEVWEWRGEQYKSTIGYVDHGREASEFFKSVMKSEKRLLRFLFGDSFVFTGNDNSENYYKVVCWDKEHNLNKENYDVYIKGN